MYYIVFTLLLFFSIIEIYTRKNNKIWFVICYVLMTAMAIFRYGQLTDYFNYEAYYDDPGAVARDPLYAAIMVFCNTIGVSFVFFSIITDILMMGLSLPFFWKLCKGYLTPLFVFYCYIFLLFPMSGLRQGTCIAVLLYCFLFLLRRKKKLFYVTAIFFSFIHFSMIIVIIIGLLYDKKFYNSKFIGWMILGCSVFALVTPDLTPYIPEFLSNKSIGGYEDSRIVQVVLRAMLILPVVYLKPIYGSLGYYAKAICIIGYCLYCSLSFSTLIAGRLEFYFRVFLCLFVTYVLCYENRSYIRKPILISILLIHAVLFFKNINSFIAQGEYNEEKVTMFNFPYISLFDKDELDNYK